MVIATTAIAARILHGLKAALASEHNDVFGAGAAAGSPSPGNDGSWMLKTRAAVNGDAQAFVD